MFADISIVNSIDRLMSDATRQRVLEEQTLRVAVEGNRLGGMTLVAASIGYFLILKRTGRRSLGRIIMWRIIIDKFTV